MSAGGSEHEVIGSRDCVLVVNDRAGIAEHVRRRYPSWDVSETATYLSAITSLSQRRVRAVLAYVDPSSDELEEAVAGLRAAAGNDATVVLCCRAEGEPVTRVAVAAGASDYLLCPLRDDELDAMLAAGDRTDSVNRPAGAAMGELRALGDVVDHLDSSAEDVLGSLAALVCAAMGAAGARVVVAGTVGMSGDAVGDPEMVESVYRESVSVGHIAIGPRVSGDYASSDVEKFRLYASLVGQIVGASLDRRRFEELAYTDELSGLPNRRFLLEFLNRHIGGDAADAPSLTLLMFDIDNFKSYNDSYGHDAGDEIIRGCGELFRRNVRDHDVVTRYGGDEFAVIFWDKDEPRVEGSHHPTTVLPLIERFRQSLRAHRFERFSMAESTRLTISGGLASYPGDASSAETLITRADEALLTAKRDGKNRIYLGGENGGPALGADGER